MILRRSCWRSPEAELLLESVRTRFRLQLLAPPAGLLSGIERIFGEKLSPREVVLKIIESVRERGIEGLRETCLRIDGFFPASLRVPEEKLAEAWEAEPREFRDAILRSAERVRTFQSRLMDGIVGPPPGARPTEGSSGEQAIRVIWRPVQSAGVHVPGGRAAYPSSVVMNAVPAQVAGVERVVLVSPPSQDGEIRRSVLAAAHALSLDEVYRLGGAQAIAALAFGVEGVRPVDKIVGPGNIFVTLAKKEVFGFVGIDMIAGPSEVVVVADETSDPRYVAADLLAQAEHDPLASALLIATSGEVVERVEREIELLLRRLSRTETILQSLRDYGGAFVVSSVSEAAEAVNRIAPEHLEILLADPAPLLAEVVNAGAIFVGPYSPEVIGDYCAGPSHTLPTGASARFSSGLSVRDFLKPITVLRLGRAEFDSLKGTATALASSEGFEAHRLAVEIRE